jgi:hypothetical protein
MLCVMQVSMNMGHLCHNPFVQAGGVGYINTVSRPTGHGNWKLSGKIMTLHNNVVLNMLKLCQASPEVHDNMKYCKKYS